MNHDGRPEQGKDAWKRQTTVIIDQLVAGLTGLRATLEEVNFAPTTKLTGDGWIQLILRAALQELNFAPGVFEKCAILGDFNPKQPERAHLLLKAMIEQNRRALAEGQLELPRLRESYGDSRHRVTLPRSALVIFPSYVNCSPDYVQSDCTIHVVESLKPIIGNVRHFEGSDDILFKPERTRKCVVTALHALRQQLESFRPELVVLDGNFIGNERTIQAEDIRELKKKYGFKLVVFVPDHYLHGSAANHAVYWNAVADKQVVFSDYIPTDPDFDAGKLIRAWLMPFAEHLFKADASKDLPFVFVGTGYRLRELWCSYAADTGVKNTVILHQRRAESTPSYGGFLNLMARAQLTINTGWRGGDNHIMTGRILEAILSNCALVQHDFSELRQFLIPFVHYLPFGNIHQVQHMVHFIAHAHETREQMVQDAREWVREHYSSRGFWHLVLRSLYPSEKLDFPPRSLFMRDFEGGYAAISSQNKYNLT